MALSLGVSRGSKIDIGSHLLEVMSVMVDHAVRVRINGRSFDLTEKQRTEVAPDVFISYGRGPTQSNGPSARLAIEAPRSMEITRRP